MIRRVVVNEYKVAYREPMWIETLLIVSIISQMKKILERSVIHRLRSDGYFDFIEQFMGSEIHGDEMNFSF